MSEIDTVTLANDGNGSISSPQGAEGTYYIAQGTVLVVSATPNSGFVFRNFTVSSQLITPDSDGWISMQSSITDNPAQIPVNENFTLTANFTPINPPPSNQAVVIAGTFVNPQGYGSITIAPSIAISPGVPSGTVVTLSALPISTTVFTRWLTGTSAQNVSIASTSPVFQVVLNSDLYVEADFDLITVTPPAPTPTSKTVAARFPMIGNRAIIQVYMRKLRDKIIRKEVHKKLHPLV
jgi:hypothetical protein